MPSVEAVKLRAYIAKNAALNVPLPEQRQLADSFADRVTLPEHLEVQPTTIAGLDAEWLIPANAPSDRAILYFHGGGFVLGSIRSHRHLAAQIAARAKIPTLIFEYRLAPEHPFPAAFDDGVSVYRDLLSEFGSGANIALVGDSAGGNLALGVALATSEQRLSAPAAIACMSPSVDLQACLRAGETLRSDDPSLSAEMVKQWMSLYLDGHDAADWRASPINGDLSSLPRLLIQAAQGELLTDQVQRFAQRCESLGRNVKLELWPDMMHDWHWFAPKLPEANEAIERIAAFLTGRIA
jgi:monoterpene epsilon-lactone hydrolase